MILKCTLIVIGLTFVELFEQQFDEKFHSDFTRIALIGVN
jgi:hypothetical protein